MRRRHTSLHWLLLSGAWLVWLLAACQGGLVTPRELTQTAAPGGPVATSEAIFSPANTPTPAAGSATTAAPTPTGLPANPNLTIWINETSAAHEAALAAMSADYFARSGVQLEVIQVDPRLLPDLVHTAVLSGTLPDLLVLPLELTTGWAQRRILDADAAAAVVAELGAATFAAAPLAAVGGADRPAAIPSDGWPQLILYRSDWFDAAGLAAPDSFARLAAAAAALKEPEALIAGIVAPTESDLVTTQQVFEQLARANGCELIDEAGEVLLAEPACLEAMEYYRALINDNSPIGVQTDVSALNAYVSGRVGIVFASTAVLPAIAGLDPGYAEQCPSCVVPPDLAANTTLLTDLSGQGALAASTGFSEYTYLGITTQAQTELATAFARYWFEEGYSTWLGVNPERKVPLRLGTAAAPTQFADAWGLTPLVPGGASLVDLWGVEVVADLQASTLAENRWAFYNDQGAVMTAMYEDLTLSVLLQELLSGYFTSSYAIIEAYSRVVELIPGYAFPVIPTPEP